MSKKTDLNAASLPQMYELHKAVDQIMGNAEGKDPHTKTTFSFSSIWNLNRLVIPTRDNMSLTPTGQPKISDWRVSDFLFTAESAEGEFGYPVGLLQRKQHYCLYREGAFPVFVDVYGNTIDIDDQELNQIINQARNFPEKLYKEFNRTLLSTVNTLILNVLDIDSDEPFGVLIAYQQAVVARICKEAKSSFPAIEGELLKLAARNVGSRMEANAQREGAETYLSLREIATSGRKFSWDRMFQETVLRHFADRLANSSCPSQYRLTKAVNELQDALGSGRHISRRGFFSRIVDAFPPLDIAIQHEQAQVAMAAATAPPPRMQGARKENSDPQHAAHISRSDVDIQKFMKDIKAELGALRTLMLRFGAEQDRKRKPDDRRAVKAHAAVVQDKKNRKAQKGTGAGSAQSLPTSYNLNSSEESEEEVHFAHYAQACDPFPTFKAESIVGPFRRTVVQSAIPGPSMSRAGYFGPSALDLSNKKRVAGSSMVERATTLSPPSTDRVMVEVDMYRVPLRPIITEYIPYPPPDLQAMLDARANQVAPSENSDDEAPDLVSTSSDEDDVDRRCAPSPLAAAGARVELSTTTTDRIRTRRMALMDSFNYPDAVLCSDGDADESVAISKTTEALYDHAVEDVSDPRPSSRTSRKVSKTGKKNGKTTTASKRLPRSGVMNRDNASRDEPPPRPRRPSFNTDAAVDSSTLVATGATGYDHFAGDAGAALTTFLAGGGM